jgi:DNA invertase Pin-like site-specific DNA recombinase
MTTQPEARSAGNNVRRMHPLIATTHLKREAWIYVRQSTEVQVRENEGSTLHQRNQVETALSFGWPQRLIRVADQDLGKSGSATELRYGWKEMLEAVARNQVGAIFVVDISRLSRQVLDFEKLRILASFHDVLFVVDGRVVDPKDPNDIVMSQITAVLAMYGNRQQTARMTAARLHQARQGKIVSPLPVGWIKRSDGTYDYDPETAPIIRYVIQTFLNSGTIYRTTRVLKQEGIKLPGRTRNKFVWREPNIQRLRYFLTNRTYCGLYIYHKTVSTPEKGVGAKGCSVRKKLPQKEWVIRPDILPPYMTVEQFQNIQSILQSNNFIKRDRVGDGRALLQGVLVCGGCGHKLCVRYPGTKGRQHGYYCNWRSLYAEPQCMHVEGIELDRTVESQLLLVLKSPPVETLEGMLEEQQVAEAKRLEQLKAQKQRLEHQARVARDRYDNCNPKYRLVFTQAQEEMEKALEELDEFNAKDGQWKRSRNKGIKRRTGRTHKAHQTSPKLLGTDGRSRKERSTASSNQEGHGQGNSRNGTRDDLLGWR